MTQTAVSRTLHCTVLVLMELVPINKNTILGRVLIEKIVLTLKKKVSQDDIKYLQVKCLLFATNKYFP